MKIVIDANRVIAALIKDGTTRSLLFDYSFDFIAPEYLLMEVKNHKSTILKASGLSEEAFDLLFELIIERVTIFSESQYHDLLMDLQHEINDTCDVPYLVVGLIHDAAGIWTHDPDFRKQTRMKVFTNIDTLNLSS
ncbi:hypothetical protein HZB02_03280 [Candidatus Woesearchaeota archaeon]|nr:hypothetical protein [Candidatus Woesearchaeota archaeon]